MNNSFIKISPKQFSIVGSITKVLSEKKLQGSGDRSEVETLPMGPKKRGRRGRPPKSDNDSSNSHASSSSRNYNVDYGENDDSDNGIDVNNDDNIDNDSNNNNYNRPNILSCSIEKVLLKKKLQGSGDRPEVEILPMGSKERGIGGPPNSDNDSSNSHASSPSRNNINHPSERENEHSIQMKHSRNNESNDNEDNGENHDSKNRMDDHNGDNIDSDSNTNNNYNTSGINIGSCINDENDGNLNNMLPLPWDIFIGEYDHRDENLDNSNVINSIDNNENNYDNNINNDDYNNDNNHNNNDDNDHDENRIDDINDNSNVDNNDDNNDNINDNENGNMNNSNESVGSSSTNQQPTVTTDIIQQPNSAEKSASLLESINQRKILNDKNRIIDDTSNKTNSSRSVGTSSTNQQLQMCICT
jgi:hypothetical protein